MREPFLSRKPRRARNRPACRSFRPTGRVVAYALTLVLFSRILSAQTNDPIFQSWRWEEEAAFAPRAAGLGGAVVGLADEASTVVSNPAGMTTLRAPGEFHLSGVNRHSQGKDVQIGFAARVTNRFALGFYVSRPRSFSVGPPPGGPREPGMELGAPGTQFNAGVTDYVGAVAWRPWLRWSLGVSGRVSHLKADGTRIPDDRSMRLHFHGSNDSYPLTVGALFMPGEQYRFGASYRHTCSWEMLREDWLKGSLGEGFTDAYVGGPRFKVVRPAVFSGAASLQPFKSFLKILSDPMLSLQVDWVRESQISKNLVVDMHRGPPFSARDYSLDDAREYRAGAEVGFRLRRPLKIRARVGLHRQESGHLQYGGLDPAESALFPKERTKRRYIGSFGLSLSGRIWVPVTLDVAMIRGGEQRTFVGGLAVRYPLAY